jgi:hypothetical protein
MARICLYLSATYAVFSILYATNDSFVYLLPALMIFALWIGLSVPYFWQLSWVKLPLGRCFLLMVLLNGMFQIIQTRQQVDPGRDMVSVDFAESYLTSAPQNAILLTGADDDTFPLWYYHDGLGWRPDVKVVPP